MKYLKYIVFVIPLVQALVAAFEGPGHGAEKKAKVLEALKETLTGFDVTGKTLELMVDFAGWFIDMLVWIWNLCGVFKHKEELEGAE